MIYIGDLMLSYVTGIGLLRDNIGDVQFNVMMRISGRKDDPEMSKLASRKELYQILSTHGYDKISLSIRAW